MSSLTSLRNLDFKGFKAKGDMIGFMLLVVLDWLQYREGAGGRAKLGADIQLGS